MAWHCKPSGGYALTSQDATDNMNEYYAYFSGSTTKNNVVGQLCNVYAESGLNPWRWQSDTVTTSGGYGLYQFTPASGYLNLTGIPGHSPNMSTSSVSGGSETDATAQMYVFLNNTLGKWHSSCWRSYWSRFSYPYLWDLHNHILNTYGNGSNITLSQFLSIDEVSDACFCFLACFEGPAVPNFETRMSYAQTISDAIGGGPIPPTPPTPGGLDLVYMAGGKKKKQSWNFRGALWK